MIAALTLVALCLQEGGAFSNPEPTRFRDALARVPLELASARWSAGPDALAVIDALRFGDVVLLDVRTGPKPGEEWDERLEVMPTCGPLLGVDAATGRERYAVARSGPCDDRLFVVPGGVLVTGVRTKRRVLAHIDGATGAVAAEVAVDAREVAVIGAGTTTVTLEATDKGARIVGRDATTLAERWSAAFAKDAPPRDVRVVGERVHVIVGDALRTLDATSGAITSEVTREGVVPVALLEVGGRAALAQVAGTPAVTETMMIDAKGAPGEVVPGLVAAMTADGFITIDGARVRRVKKGVELWRRDLAQRPSGAIALGKRTLAVPHDDGVSVLDLDGGAVRAEVRAFARMRLGARTRDALFFEDGRYVLDTPDGVAAFDESGALQWSFEVRSLGLVHREARSRMAAPAAEVTRNFGLATVSVDEGPRARTDFSLAGVPGTGLAFGATQVALAGASYAVAVKQQNWDAMIRGMREKRVVDAAIAERLDADQRATPYLVRPIVWARGRGFLVVRKKDGAFVEVVTGPADVYEDIWRVSSAALVVGDLLMSASEGAPGSWPKAARVAHAELVPRRWSAFALDAARFVPAAQYPATSRVPASDVD